MAAQLQYDDLYITCFYLRIHQTSAKKENQKAHMVASYQTVLEPLVPLLRWLRMTDKVLKEALIIVDQQSLKVLCVMLKWSLV